MAYEWIIDGLAQTWDDIDRVTRHLTSEQFAAATACPGWSVQDVLSHLVGFELMLSGEPVPDVEVGSPAYVKNPIGEINEKFVVARRERDGREVVEEFRDVCARSLANLRAKPDEEWDVVGWSPEGDAPFWRFMETRTLDSWIHLQDIRDALLEPQDDHGAGEEIVVNRFEAALPYVIGRRAKAPDGTTVRVNLIGRLARVVSVEVVDGRARATEAISGVPTVEITTPVALFWRRMAGRISAEAFLAASATDAAGDRALARAIADGMSIMI